MQTIKNIHKKKRSFPLGSLFLSTSLEELGKMQETFWSRHTWNVYNLSFLVCYIVSFQSENWFGIATWALETQNYFNIILKKFLMLTIEWKYLQMSSKGFCRYFTKDATRIFLQQMHFAVEADFASKLCWIILHSRSRCK